MLQEVGDEDAVEVLLRQLGVHDVGDDHLDAGVLQVSLADEVHAPPFCRRYRGDELTTTRGRVEDRSRLPQAQVDIARDLPPDRLPARLIDIAEPVRV